MVAGKLKQVRAAHQRNGMLFMGVAALLWALAEALVGLLPRGVSVPVIVLTRYGTHLVALVSLSIGRFGPALFRTRRPALQIGRGLLMLGMPLSSVMAVARAPVDAVWAIFWLMPLLVVGLGHLLLRERVGWLSWLTTLVGTAGALLLIRPGAGGLLAAAAPALAMALCFALYLVLTRLLRDEPTPVNLFYTGASVLVPLTVAAPLYWQTPPAAAWPILTAIGLVGLVALYAFDHACALAAPAELAPLLYLQPIALFVLSSLHMGAAPAPHALAGTLIIVVAIVLAHYGRRTENRMQP